MGRYPNVFCYKCGSNRFMSYDVVNSKKDPSRGDTVTYWCMNEKKHGVLLIVTKEFQVKDSVTSAKQFIFGNRENFK
ncbi:MAG: hypothetical protein FJ356_01990 [Thaumarchaeota archaeon]|nr:hypothetical protein [Nitrososphaerota archaeon]